MATEYASLVFRVDSSALVTADDRLEKVQKQSGQTEKATHGVKRSFDSTSASTRLFTRALGALAAAMSVREIVRYADAWTNLENRIKLTTDTTEELHRAQSDLFGVAQETRQSLESTVQLYQRVAVNADRLGISYTELIDITKTINQAMAVSGATAQESANAIIQLGQALGSGELRGEELRSVMEQAPRLRDALVDGLGVDGVGALRDLAEAGELTSERVVQALQSQSAVINEEFGTMEATVGQASSTLGNSFTLLIGRMNEAVGFTDGLANAMMGLAGAMEALATGPQVDHLESMRLAAQRQMDTFREGSRAWEDARDRVAEYDAQIQALMATQSEFERQQTGVTVQPLQLQGLVSGDGGESSEGATDVGLKDFRAQAQEQELVDAKDHAAKMAAIDQELIDQKMAGYDMLFDAANAYFGGMQGKQAAYARAALSIGQNLMDEEKREALKSMWAKTGSAAMGAYEALSNIPVVGPALGAAAYAGVYAVGAATVAKMTTGGRELGGQVLPNNSYIVGERGPEVLTMGSTAGNVSQIPQGQQQQQAPQEVIINQTIQAVDAKSVQNVLFDNQDYLAGLINRVMNDRGMAL